MLYQFDQFKTYLSCKVESTEILRNIRVRSEITFTSNIPRAFVWGSAWFRTSIWADFICCFKKKHSVQPIKKFVCSCFVVDSLTLISSKLICRVMMNQQRFKEISEWGQKSHSPQPVLKRLFEVVCGFSLLSELTSSRASLRCALFNDQWFLAVDLFTIEIEIYIS